MRRRAGGGAGTGMPFRRPARPLRVVAPLRLRLVLRRLGVALLQLAVLALGLGSGGRIASRFLESGEFDVRSIEIAGVRYASPAELRDSVERYAGDNLLRLDLGAVERRVEEHRWVREASVRRILPGALRITVRERVPRAVALLDGRPMLVDDDGAVVGPLAEWPVADFPVLRGADAPDVDARRLRLREAVAALERLAGTEPAMTRRISELDFSSAGRIVARTVAGDPPLLLDPQRIERNVGPYLALRASIAERIGGAEYVDLRWDGRIAVKPREPERAEHAEQGGT